MGNEAFVPVSEAADTALEFEAAGKEFLDAYGAGDLAGREIEIVHDGGVYKGTIADAIGGRCPEFRMIAESIAEVGGREMLSASIEKYVEKSELKKKS